jgi:DNA topoisomerase-1
LGGQPRAEAVESEHTCPKCGKPLLIRENKRGEKFLSCSGYPECKESFNIDEEGKPVPSRIETEHVCEKCGKPMALRQGRRGPFLGCTGYPKCKNVVAVDSDGKPVATVKIDIKCEKCGKPMAVRQGRRGAFLGCTGYPKCRGTAPVPDDLKEQLAELAPAQAAASGPDLKAIEVDETCDDCGNPMVVRRGRRGFFLGCSKYPKCKGTKEPGEATQAKIAAVTEA